MYSTTTNLTNNIHELQADVLAENLESNPYLKYHILIEKNKKLGTINQNIVGAINELLKKINSANATYRTSLAEMYALIGHIGSRPDLTRRILSKNESLVDYVLSLNDRVNIIDEKSSVPTQDVFNIGEEKQHDFPLNHIPTTGDIDFAVNGVRYYNTESRAYYYDSDNNIITWKFDEDDGGFDLVDCEVVIKYTYNPTAEQEES